MTDLIDRAAVLATLSTMMDKTTADIEAYRGTNEFLAFGAKAKLVILLDVWMRVSMMAGMDESDIIAQYASAFGADEQECVF